ncbi:MAG TPA: rhomboid family intramembrane serine protease [Chitinophagaceae bacterium]|nr:rhomboid family intramembrane serine protease [Chitinophagaceae bacterium]
MSGSGIISFAIIVINVIFSYNGFKNALFFERYKFEVDKILINKDYKRFVTSGFLHVSWQHLIFNMFSLYFFSGGIEYFTGSFQFLLIYLASLIGGNLLSLVIHRNEGDYSSVGASGAVCGVIFASIALFPGMGINLIITIPGWLYGILFVLGSIYGIRSRRDNIGHDAHLGGALIGMLVALVLHPDALFDNYVTILVIAAPCIFFIIMIITKPGFLLIDNPFFNKHNKNYTLDQRYNMDKIDKQKEIDRILDKINRSGIKSLTPKEKQVLDEYSRISQ